MLTIRPSGSAPAAARSLRLTAAARKPRSRQVIQSRRKWTPSTSASCVTTAPAISAVSFSMPWTRPRRSSSASRPSSPTSASRGIDGRAYGRRLRDGTDDGDAPSAGGDAVRRIRRADSADRHDRNTHRLADRGEAVEADRLVGVGLGRRRPDGARADVAGAAADAVARLIDVRGGDSEQQARAARARLTVVVAAEMHTVGAKRERRLDVVVDDEHDARGARHGGDGTTSLDDLGRGQALEAQLDDGRPTVAGTPGGRGVPDDAVELHAPEMRVRGSRASGVNA